MIGSKVALRLLGTTLVMTSPFFSKVWRVSETTTGMAVIKGAKSESEAITKGKEKLDEVGKMRLERAIKDGLKKQKKMKDITHED